MAYRKNLKAAISLIKAATFLIKRNTILHLAVLRATSPNSSSPPSDHRITAVLSFGNGSRQTACTCIQSLMDRLHATNIASVALKCLFTIHCIITDGSFILKDQLSIFPSSGGRNFLKMSRFCDKSGQEGWELSSWVRWYAYVVETNLTASRFLGHFLNPYRQERQDKVLGSGSGDLLKEIEFLVDFVEVICSVPESLHLQKNDLVYEVVKRVGEDYRIVQREIFVRVKELRIRIGSLSSGEVSQLLSSLKRLEDYRKMVGTLFANRARNDGLWEVVGETKKLILEMGERRRLGRIGWEGGPREERGLVR